MKRRRRASPGMILDKAGDEFVNEKQIVEIRLLLSICPLR